MFICDITGAYSQLGEKVTYLVANTRPKSYRAKVYNETLRSYETVVVGEGWEIVKELKACAKGVAVWNELDESERTLLGKMTLRERRRFVNK